MPASQGRSLVSEVLVDDEPVLHILPHWNLQGHEGDSIDIWVYSNCDEVELTVNGKKLDRKPMPRKRPSFLESRFPARCSEGCRL